MSSPAPHRDRAADPLVGTLIDGRFLVQKRLAAGGMGVVYKAEQQPLGRPIALKVLQTKQNAELDANFRERFFLEAAAVAKLNHPNTLVIYDYGKTPDDVFFIAMEFLEGHNLAWVIKKRGPLPPLQAIHVGKQVAGSLGDAHAAGMVHRDLKPGNVMLMTRGKDDHFAKVLDFGLVKMVDSPGVSQLTQSGVMMGSPHYMAPEQVRGRSIDARTDIYAFGALMYHLLTGVPPFSHAETNFEAMTAHVSAEPPPFRSKWPDCPASPSLEAVVLRCLAKPPEQRFQSMEELASALEECEMELKTGMSISGSMLSSSLALQPPPSTSGPQGYGSGPHGSGARPVGSQGAQGYGSGPQYGSGQYGSGPQGSGPQGSGPQAGYGSGPQVPQGYATGPQSAYSTGMLPPGAYGTMPPHGHPHGPQGYATGVNPYMTGVGVPPPEPSSGIGKVVLVIGVLVVVAVGVGLAAFFATQSNGPEGIVVASQGPEFESQGQTQGAQAGGEGEAAAAPRPVRLITEPAGAHASVDGQDLGDTPVPLVIPAGQSWTIHLTLEGHEPRDVRVTAGQPDVNVRLAAVRVEGSEGGESEGAEASGGSGSAQGGRHGGRHHGGGSAEGEASSGQTQGGQAQGGQTQGGQTQGGQTQGGSEGSSGSGSSGSGGGRTGHGGHGGGTTGVDGLNDPWGN